VAQFEDAIKEKLFSTQEQRDLYKYIKFADYIRQLFDATLLPDDYQYLVNLDGSVKADVLAHS